MIYLREAPNCTLVELKSSKSLNDILKGGSKLYLSGIEIEQELE